MPNHFNYMYLVIIGFVVLSFVYTRIVMGRSKGQADDFYKKNPNAGKIYVEDKNSPIAYLFGFGKYMRIASVDGNTAVYSAKEGKTNVYYVLPGERKLEVTYQSKRPGIFHKSVTKTYNSSDLALSVEEQKSYTLSFNKSIKNFEIIARA